MAVAPLIAALPGIITAGAAGVGAYSTIKGARDAKKAAPKVAELPKPPTVEESKSDAAAELQKRRRISILSGGQTDITQGTAAVGAGQVGQKQLLGA